MNSSLPDISRIKLAGGKRSRKRERIVNVFLKQDGHLSADDLVDLIRNADQRISRATVYRTLQWMVDAGVARKVDFGEGRFRFEHSYRQPRHFHLICKTCSRSFEFLSSDVEALVEEVAAARGFTTTKSVVQIYGTCEECRTGRHASLQDGHSDLLFARDALRMAIATERSGAEFYARAAKITKDARGRKIFDDLAKEELEHLGQLESRYSELLERDPLLESRPTFLFFKGAANGLFAEGAERLLRGVNDQQALLIGIRCERGSHRFFKKYGERFEDSEGKQIFLEFADEERNHLDLLVREYRALVKRQGRSRRAPLRGDPARVIDLHLHTTASDGRLSPRDLVTHAAAAGLTVMAVTDHDTTAAVHDVQRFAAGHGIEAISGIEVTAVENGRDVHILGYFADPDDAALEAFLASQRRRRIERVRAMAELLGRLGMPVDVGPLLADVERNSGRSIGRPQVAQAMVAAGHVTDIRTAFDRWLGQGGPAFIAREGSSGEEVIAILHRARGLSSLAHPGKTSIDARIPALREAGLDAIEAYHSSHDGLQIRHYTRMASTLGMLLTGGSDFHGDPSHGLNPGASTLPPAAWQRLRDARPNA